MKKFRKWLFKILTGYNLIEYEDIMRKWSESINLTKECQEANGRILKHATHTIELADKVNKHCTHILKLCEEIEAKE